MTDYTAPEDRPTVWINYPGWERDTRTLSTEQCGVLFQMMLLRVGPDGPLPDDPETIRKKVNCTAKKWARHWPVLRNFLKPGGMPWLQVSEEMPEGHVT